MILTIVSSADSSCFNFFKTNSVISMEWQMVWIRIKPNSYGRDLYQNSAFILITFSVGLDQLLHIVAK